MKVIGIIGSAGHGKDTVCEMMLDQDEQVKRIALADKLKEEIAQHYHMFPEFQIRFDRQGRLSYVVPREDIEPWKESFRRRTYQVWGTEGRREIWPTWWLREWAVRAVASGTEGFHTVVVPDLRFRNEMEFMRDEVNAVIIGVDRGAYRREGTDYTHASEAEIPELLAKADQVIKNLGDISDLEHEVRKLMG